MSTNHSKKAPGTPPSAAIIVIGNEILSGRVADQNSPFLARRLRELGVDLCRIEVIPDEVDDIVRALQDHAKFDYVFTSGGVGPTPDDVTVPAVAKALGRKIVRSPALERLLRDYYKVDELTLFQGRLADIPEGSELIYSHDSPYPQLVVDNVYVFPGVPELLVVKFEQIAELLRGEPVEVRVLHTALQETQLAPFLVELGEEYPSVRIGSYPQDEQVELVFESRVASDLQMVFERMQAWLRRE